MSVDVVLDVGHNPQAARELAAWLQTHPDSRPKRMSVFAALADKDVASVVDVVRGHCRCSGTWPDSMQGRASQSADQLAARLVETVSGTRRIRHPRVVDAIAAALASAAARPGDRVLVFGSFHTVAEAMQALHSGR